MFEKDIAEVFRHGQFPYVSSPDVVKDLLTQNPEETNLMLIWQEHHIVTLLQELHRLTKAYFGSTNFAHQVVERLQDMPEGERSLFISWLNQSSVSKLWH